MLVSFPSSEINRVFAVMIAAFFCIIYVISIPAYADQTVCGVTMSDADYSSFIANGGKTSPCSEIYAGESFPYDSYAEANAACVGFGYSRAFAVDNYFIRTYYRTFTTPHVGISGNSGINGTPVVDSTFINNYHLNTVYPYCYSQYPPTQGGITYASMSGDRPTTPSAQFSGTPTSGYPPLTVQFTDSSLYLPTSWYWDFGDGNTSTVRNASHEYVTAGIYTVSLRATNAQGSDWENKTSYITVNAYQMPSCSFTANPQTGNSPYTITFTDTSSNVPTSYFWNFDSDAQPWISISPHNTNTTQNPVITVSGTGDFYTLHTVTNPAGTSTCPLLKFDISGTAPTPTPTPTIPFPNQTGICYGQEISLGSQTSLPFARYGELTEPDGNSYNFYYSAGQTALSSGVYTTKFGTYVYNEYNLSTQLLYRSSYVVSDCSTPTPVPTTITTYLPTATPYQTYPSIPPTYTVEPTGNFSPSYIPTIVPIPTLDVNTGGNITNITPVRQRLLDWNPTTIFTIRIVEELINTINDLTLGRLIYISSAILFSLSSPLTYVISVYNSLFPSFGIALSLITWTLVTVIAQIPIKVQNAITLFLAMDIISQIYNIKHGRL